MPIRQGRTLLAHPNQHVAGPPKPIGSPDAIPKPSRMLSSPSEESWPSSPIGSRKSTRSVIYLSSQTRRQNAKEIAPTTTVTRPAIVALVVAGGGGALVGDAYDLRKCECPLARPAPRGHQTTHQSQKRNRGAFQEVPALQARDPFRATDVPPLRQDSPPQPGRPHPRATRGRRAWRALSDWRRVRPA